MQSARILWYRVRQFFRTLCGGFLIPTTQVLELKRKLAQQEAVFHKLYVQGSAEIQAVMRKEKELAAQHDRLIGSLQTLIRNNSELEERVFQQSAAIEKLRRDAHHDELSGLLNRRGIQKALTREMHVLQRAYAKKPEGEPPGFSLIAFDLDKFKVVNDRWGHQNGDQVIVSVAQTMREAFHRDTDILGRSGGDEFVIMLPGVNIAQAAKRAEYLRKLLCENRDLTFEDFQVTGSIGVAYSVATIDAQIEAAYHAACMRADQAAYASKEKGGNGVSVN